ncbi:MAG: amidohydrolase [Planctomycetaceae bacterium]|nr:amidohydrolase [Planctomycetaceae bacterium]
MASDWHTALDEIVRDLEPRLIELRRHLHAHPEPSGEELQTSLRLYQMLGDEGLAVRMGPEGCGVLVDEPRDAKGARVAFRGDIDALLIQDEKLVSYHSTRAGVMHACGHDAHATCAYGAAVALRRLVQQNLAPWPLTWRAILQPAEETASGARQMVAAGAMDRVERIFALHVEPKLPVGTVGVRSGPMTANCDLLKIAIHGRGGHGARPHESRDPIAAAATLISTLYQYVPRATDSLEAVVVSIGRVCGGSNPNVIPEHVELEGTVRTLESSVRLSTIDHIQQLARGVEEITGAKIEVQFSGSIPAVFNDADATETLRTAAAEVVGPQHCHLIARPSMGSEDFACYLEHAPGAMFRLGTAGDLSAITPLHTSRFDVDEKALTIGARVLARAVVAACEPKDGNRVERTRTPLP